MLRVAKAIDEVKPIAEHSLPTSRGGKMTGGVDSRPLAPSAWKPLPECLKGVVKA